MNDKPEQPPFDWKLEIATGPDQSISVNGKELKGFEEYLQQMSTDNKLNWWELAGVLFYMGMAQIAAADDQAQDGEALLRSAGMFGQMYQIHRDAFANGSNEIVNPLNRTVN